MDDPEDWSTKQLKLIGEFLRRHHHRLAHQIAGNGFPGPVPRDDRTALQGLDADLADAVGLVARSHGMPLRDSFSYLDAHLGLRTYRRMHPVFLMSLLRVADYLQVEAERAPTQLLAVRRLRSPVSRGEWSKHEAVRDIRTDEPDIEAIYVEARPDDIKTYLGLKELLAGLQCELDASWAVLGEVYSRYAELARLGLTIRRVRSNLDDEEEFARTVDYVPCHAAFDTAGPELMKLLVEPLYGDNPAIGVRELLQNAIDAVREREALCRLASEPPEADKPDDEVDVTITLKQEDDGSFWLVVEDNGIGMTADTIRDYFLTAGACIRRAPGWRKTFEDDEGHVRVLRSGRFGIGVFAAFLLGQRLKVSSRHVDEARGLEFDASIEDYSVELRKVERRIGTTVSVELGIGSAARLLDDPVSWDWFTLSDPVVRRHTDVHDRSRLREWHRSDEVRRGSESGRWRLRASGWRSIYRSTGAGVAGTTVPAPGSILPPDWRRVRHGSFHDLQWSYSRVPTLICNGIIVDEQPRVRELPPDWVPIVETALNQSIPPSELIRFRLPACSCFDPDGLMPLNLQRTAVTQAYPFVRDLASSIVDDFLGYVLVAAPTSPMRDCRALRSYASAGYPGLGLERDTFPREFVPWVGTALGITLPIPWLLVRAVQPSQTVACAVFDFDRWSVESCDRASPYLSHLDNVFALTTSLLGLGGSTLHEAAIRFAQGFPVSSLRVIVRGLASQAVPDRLPSSDLWAEGCPSTHSWERSLGAWRERRYSQAPEHDSDLLGSLATSTAPAGLRPPSHVVIVDARIRQDMLPKVPKSPVSERWMELFRMPAIPYDLQERREKLAHACKVLDEYVRAWEAVLGHKTVRE